MRGFMTAIHSAPRLAPKKILPLAAQMSWRNRAAAWVMGTAYLRFSRLYPAEHQPGLIEKRNRRRLRVRSQKWTRQQQEGMPPPEFDFHWGWKRDCARPLQNSPPICHNWRGRCGQRTGMVCRQRRRNKARQNTWSSTAWRRQSVPRICAMHNADWKLINIALISAWQMWIVSLIKLHKME